MAILQARCCREVRTRQKQLYITQSTDLAYKINLKSDLEPSILIKIVWLHNELDTSLEMNLFLASYCLFYR